MRKASFVMVCLLCGLTLAGCANSRSVLVSGITPGVSGAKIVIDDATALRDARGIRKHWLGDIARRGRTDPRERFANPSIARFRRQLATAATHYGFVVKSLRFLRPRQLAPLVVVQTTHYVALAHAFHSIDQVLNPLNDRHVDRFGGGFGGAFEAFFFEAQDERGVPFFVIADAVRGSHAYGQNWARAEALYVSVHG